MSSHELYKPVRLDQDLIADRRRRLEADPLNVRIPDDISANSEVTIEILDHREGNQYDIHFSSGEWRREEGTIFYRPALGRGEVTLTIRHNNEKLFGVVVYENGTVYDDKGEIQRGVLSNGTATIEKLNIDLSLLKPEVSIITPPLPTNTDGGTNTGSSSLLNFNLNNLFGDLDSQGLNKALSTKKNGNVSDYFLPSESNKTPDAERGIYEEKNGKIGFNPRNSNVTEAEGDVLSGYREKGAIGGSLTVITGDELPLREDRWVFEVQNNDIDAIMPDDIVALCLSTVTFTPILRGDPEGHTFEWEQIKGDDTSITWLTPKNQVEIVLALGPIKVDRTFRFWIDKGTPNAKFYDVNIYGTPFERVTTPNGGYVPHNANNHLNIHTHDTGPILLWNKNVWNKQLRLRITRKY